MSGFCVNPNKHGFKKLEDMIDYARASPGKLTFGSFGPGTTTHLRIEMLKFKTRTDILHVPYGAGQESLPAGDAHMVAGHSLLHQFRPVFSWPFFVALFSRD